MLYTYIYIYKKKKKRGKKLREQIQRKDAKLVWLV